MFVAICVPRVVVLVRSTYDWPEFVYAGCKFVFGELHFQIFFFYFPKISDGIKAFRQTEDQDWPTEWPIFAGYFRQKIVIPSETVRRNGQFPSVTPVFLAILTGYAR